MKLSAKQPSKEIEMQRLTPRIQLNVVLPPIRFPALNLPPVRLLLIQPKEFIRVPRNVFPDPLPENAEDHALGALPDVLWAHIFPFMDISTLALMMVTCKKMAHLMNDNVVRERLYTEKRNCFFRACEQERRLPLPLLQNLPQLPQAQAAVVLAPPAEVSNPGTDGQNDGFVMRR